MYTLKKTVQNSGLKVLVSTSEHLTWTADGSKEWDIFRVDPPSELVNIRQYYLKTDSQNSNTSATNQKWCYKKETHVKEPHLLHNMTEAAKQSCAHNLNTNTNVCMNTKTGKNNTGVFKSPTLTQVCA